MNEYLLSSAYLGPVQYYARLYAATRVVEDDGEHYLKQTYRNRCVIAGPAGRQALTVPVERPGGGKTPMRDVRISEHGNWRHLHWAALVTAYEGSPFFEYYADDFRPFYERRYGFLVDFNAALQDTVLDLLGLDVRVERSRDYVEPAPGLADCRALISPKTGWEADVAFRPAEYYQVFSARHGFLPNLSVVDLLFNMGPEARLVLRDSVRRDAPQACGKGNIEPEGKE